MFLLNLSLAEFLALASAASALVVALYLLDRTRRRQTVGTLRFWNVAEKIAEMKHRRRIQQPWSLILQIFSILLLLAALAQLRWGSLESGSRDHVILLDTSAWMAARGRTGTLMDEAKAAALAYLRAMPAPDRAMIVRADAVALPATRFESNRAALEEAVRQTRPGSAALSLDEAIRFGLQAQRLEGRSPGEIVYAGAGRVPKQDAAAQVSAARLRVLPIGEPADNCGLRRISLRRSHADPAVWEIFVAVRNYGRMPRQVPLALTFGNAPIGADRLSLAPGEEAGVTFRYRTRAAGWIEARLLIQDALAEDNRALLELPAQPAVRVQVYSDQPNLLRPVLSANPNVAAVFASPSAYNPKNEARIVVLDRFRPPAPPDADTMWIEPPAGASPFVVLATVKETQLERWHPENALGAGLRTRDLKLDSTEVFTAASGDLPIADCAAGPVILARPGKRKSVAFGFHPGRTAMRFELATPLVFANILRWMAPEVFRRWELNGGSVGTLTTPMEAGTDPAAIQVLAADNRPLPFTMQDNSLRFFTASPGTVRVLAGDRETVYSLTLPEVAEARWEPPSQTLRGVPRPAGTGPASRDLWQALALAGAAGLFAEWMLFGRGLAPRRKTA
ncbi:MAG: VWA domain-containing protein [Bryobacterales bacterium]|nr:VWA domain-containing protein [Bryobacterales bacterium]